MGNSLIVAGLLLNSALMIMNRFVKRLPDWLQIPLLLLSIGLILTGAYLMRQ